MAFKLGIAVATQSMNCLDGKDHTDSFYVTAQKRGSPRQRTKLMYNTTNNRDHGDQVKYVNTYGWTIPELEVVEDSFEETFDFDMKDKMISSKLDICTSGPEISEESPERMGVKLLVHAAPGTVDSTRDHMHKTVIVKTLEEKQAEPHLPETRTDFSVPKLIKSVTLLFILCFASMFSPGESLLCVHTNQTLPQMCWKMLNFLGMCPNPDITTESKLTYWSKVCCQEFENTTFHCQQNENGMQDEVFPACLEEQVCNAGFFCTLQVGENGFPKFVQEACEDGFYEPMSRFTPLMVNPTCSRSHTQCDPVKAQALFCRGDATTDTQCVCADGYILISKGPATFTEHDVSECAQSTDKKSCTRWPNLFCSQLSQEQLMNITCTAPSTPAASTTTPGDIVHWSNTIEHSSTTSTPLSTTTNRVSPWIIVVMVVLAVALVILILACIVIHRKKRKRCIYLNQKPENYCPVCKGDMADSSV